MTFDVRRALDEIINLLETRAASPKKDLHIRIGKTRLRVLDLLDGYIISRIAEVFPKFTLRTQDYIAGKSNVLRKRVMSNVRKDVAERKTETWLFGLS